VVTNFSGVDLAMLSREVTDLAGLGEFAVTGRSLEMYCQRRGHFDSRGGFSYLATNERVKMS
jgi:hypothetical protein